MSCVVPTTSSTSIDDEIIRVKEEIESIKQRRIEERELFTENQATYCVRQHYSAQELNRRLPLDDDTADYNNPRTRSLSHVRKLGASSPYYSRAIQDLSKHGQSSLYTMARETELCRALHQVEIRTNQLRLVAQYQDSMVEFLEKFKDEELLMKRKIVDDDLAVRVKFKKIDLSGTTVDRQKKLQKQFQTISVLKGEIANTEDCSNISSSSSISSTESTLTATTVSSSASSIVSHLFSYKNTPPSERKQGHRNSMEQRITQVGSYFGIRKN
mmetsp:Transcript_16254/g.18064  ORF Transcript_16254/g.18064 Transcript_16254/m.18064 type:complete len:271 (-) Transcript_16254:156-968(-)